MLGKLTWAAIPFDQPIPLIAGAVVLVGILAVPPADFLLHNSLFLSLIHI